MKSDCSLAGRGLRAVISRVFGGVQHDLTDRIAVVPVPGHVALCCHREEPHIP